MHRREFINFKTKSIVHKIKIAAENTMLIFHNVYILFLIILYSSDKDHFFFFPLPGRSFLADLARVVFYLCFITSSLFIFSGSAM